MEQWASDRTGECINIALRIVKVMNLDSPFKKTMINMTWKNVKNGLGLGIGLSNGL